MKSPGIVNTTIFFFTEIKLMYNSVMTIEHSPLKNFEPMVAHMMFQILALLWSGIFAAMLGSYVAFGISAVFHIFFIAGMLITVLVFREGNKKRFMAKSTRYNGRAHNGEHY